MNISRQSIKIICSSLRVIAATLEYELTREENSEASKHRRETEQENKKWKLD